MHHVAAVALRVDCNHRAPPSARYEEFAPLGVPRGAFRQDIATLELAASLRPADWRRLCRKPRGALAIRRRVDECAEIIRIELVVHANVGQAVEPSNRGGFVAHACRSSRRDVDGADVPRMFRHDFRERRQQLLLWRRRRCGRGVPLRERRGCIAETGGDKQQELG